MFYRGQNSIKTSNLLKEINCINNETLTFDSKNFVISNQTFNPDIKIGLKMGTIDNYIFNIICDEVGSVGFATTFSVKGNQVFINESEAVLSGNQLLRSFTGAIKIFNEDFTEVIATKDLILVYVKG